MKFRKKISELWHILAGVLGFLVIRPYCADDSLHEYACLTDWGFHEAFANNPHIIFSRGGNGLKLSKSLVVKSCKMISGFVEKELWKGRWWQLTLRLAGVSRPLVGNLGLLLQPASTYGYNDQKDYPIGPSAARPEGKVVVYSVMIGHYDSVLDPVYITPGVDYLLFTDCEVKSKIWKVMKVGRNGLSDILLSRRIKMLPWEYLPRGYDYSIYVDANVIIWGDITVLTTYLSDKISFAVSAHSVRSSVREELNELLALSMVDRTRALDMYDGYARDGFPDGIGLAECTLLVRNHNDENLRNLMRLWWKEFSFKGVYRDQLSLMYCLWKMDFKDHYVLMDGHVMNNQYCTVRSHIARCHDS